MKSNLLTASRLKSARSCKREHRIKYELGYRPVVDTDELFFGTLVHLALQAWWLAVKAGTWEASGLVLAIEAMRAVKCNLFDLARAEAMIMGYDARWSSEAAHFEVLGVEERFECDVVNPDTGHASKTWRLGGKLDVRVRDRRDGKVKFIEHKTSSEDVSPGSVYQRRLRMDGQVSVYFDGCEALGTPAEACIYDVLGKPQQRPSQVPLVDEVGVKIVLDKDGNRVRTARGKYRETGDKEQGFVLQTREETPDEYRLRIGEAIVANVDRYYARFEVVRLEQELRDSRFDIWAMGRELRENELAKRAQRNPDACERYGRMCPYFDVCCGQASLEDPVRFRLVEDVHPELAPDPQASSPKEEGAWQPQQ